MKLTKDQIDSVKGFITGDCLGVPYEFRYNHNISRLDMVGHGTHDQLAGTWSDDTAFILATLDCEFTDKDILLDNLRGVLLGDYTTDNFLFDVGYATKHSLMGFVSDVNQSGNGAMMRMLPYAFLDRYDWKELVVHSNYLTHNSSLSAFCCVVYICIVREFLKGNYNAREVLNDRLKIATALEISVDEKLTYEGYVWHSLLHVVDIVESAISYKDGVKAIINTGGDTDTHSALAGALLAIKYKDWKNLWKKVRNIEKINVILNKCL